MRPVRLELNPILAACLVVLGLALLGWAGATTSYAVFRDEFLTQLISRHTTTERHSRAEIARLRDDYERVNSQLLVERENFATELGELARRQAAVEKRQDVLSRLEGSLPHKIGQSGAAPASEENLGGLRLHTDEPRRESRAAPMSDAAKLRARYDEIEADQRRQIAAVQNRLDEKRSALNDVYAALGLQPEATKPVKAGMGGLYLPFGFGGSGSTASDVDQLTETAHEADMLREGLSRVPVGKPLPQLRTVSGFGNRTDPFLGGIAFHSGIDLESASGAPAYATATGTVTAAEWNGGYGLMVDIQHDHGYATRYAHLSRIAVKEGQDVKAGDVIGFVGSTGRSTGPHLHYETRRNDTPLNPTRFLKIADAIAD